MNDEDTEVGRSTLVAMAVLFLQSVLTPLKDRGVHAHMREGLGKALVVAVHTALLVNNYGRLNTDKSIFECCPGQASMHGRGNSFGIVGPVNQVQQFTLTFAGNGLFFSGLYHALTDFQAHIFRAVDELRKEVPDLFDEIDACVSEFLTDITRIGRALEENLLNAGCNPKILEKGSRADFSSLTYEDLQELEGLDIDEDTVEIDLMTNNLSCCPRCQRDVRVYDFPELEEFYSLVEKPREEE